jgi:transcription elongation GreA/GreB family factor
MMTFKEKVHTHFMQVINKKIEHLQQILTDLKESGSNETKSTAGDKHETALAMLQIEQANTRAQLKEIQEQKAVLEKINPLLTPAAVVNGSLIKTNKGYLFLSVALGKALVDGIKVTALSAHSPLGMQLLHKQTTQAVTVNGNQYIVEALF